MRLNENTYPSYMTLEKGNYAMLRIDAMFDKILTTPEAFNGLVGGVKKSFLSAKNKYYLTKPFKEAIFQAAPKLKDKLFDMPEPATGIFFTDSGFTIFNWDPRSEKERLVLYGFTREVMTTFSVMDGEGTIGGVACSLKNGMPYDDQDGLISWTLTSLLALNFIEHCEIEQKLLKPKEKYRNAGQKYYNESKSDIKILDCRWFTELLRDTPFTVRGHLRWQFHGEGRKGRKLIWIDEFQKEGYHRKATKEAV